MATSKITNPSNVESTEGGAEVCASSLTPEQATIFYQLVERATPQYKFIYKACEEDLICGFAGLLCLYRYAKALKGFIMSLDGSGDYDRQRMNMLLRAMGRSLMVDFLAAPFHYLLRNQYTHPRWAAHRAVTIFRNFCEYATLPMGDSAFAREDYKKLFPESHRIEYQRSSPE